MKRKTAIVVICAAFLFFIAVVLTFITQIPSYSESSAKQRRCVDGFVRQIGVAPGEIAQQDRKKSLELIEKVRAHIFKTIKLEYRGSEYAHDNRPCAVIERGWGVCFNVSRLFELIMQSMGYRTRHVFLAPNWLSAERTHAVSEVLVAGRWVGVDSYFKDVKFYSGNELFSVKEALKDRTAPGLDKNYGKNYHVIYGLYSRSGLVFREKIPWPDINIGEFMYNFYPDSGQRRRAGRKE